MIKPQSMTLCYLNLQSLINQLSHHSRIHTYAFYVIGNISVVVYFFHLSSFLSQCYMHKRNNATYFLRDKHKSSIWITQKTILVWNEMETSFWNNLYFYDINYNLKFLRTARLHIGMSSVSGSEVPRFKPQNRLKIQWIINKRTQFRHDKINSEIESWMENSAKSKIP